MRQLGLTGQAGTPRPIARATARILPALLLAVVIGGAGCDSCLGGGTEECWNYEDDDGDGLADCFDDECVTSIYCLCANDPNCECPGVIGAPNPDGGAADGGIISLPPDASIPTTAPECIELNCDDREDNDQDGTEDCEDTDCYAACGVELGNWEQIDAGAAIKTTENLFGVWGLDPDRVWAVGSAGTILTWDGVAWTKQAVGTEDLRDVHVVETSMGEVIGHAVGFNGTLLRLEAGVWMPETSPVAVNLYGVWTLPDGDNAYAVGDDGTILRRAAAMNMWIAAANPVQDRLFAVWAAAQDQMIAAGAFSTLAVLNGMTWGAINLADCGFPLTDPWRGIWGNGAGDVYYVGVGGNILNCSGGCFAASRDPMGNPLGCTGTYTLFDDPAPPLIPYHDMFQIDNHQFIVGMDGFIVHRLPTGEFLHYIWDPTLASAGVNAPPTREPFRWDAVWGYNPYDYYDAGMSPDSSVPDLGVPYKMYVVGASGRIFFGP